MGRERDDAPPELAAWAGRRGASGAARTAELAVVVTEHGPAWVCRLWAGNRCVAVGRAGVGEPSGRGLAVRRACEAAGFVMPEPEPEPEPAVAVVPGVTDARGREEPAYCVCNIGYLASGVMDAAFLAAAEAAHREFGQ